MNSPCLFPTLTLQYCRVPSLFLTQLFRFSICVCVQLSLLSELGFGGVLLYIDPCDAPPGRHISHQAFRVTLNPGGNPAVGECVCRNDQSVKSTSTFVVTPRSYCAVKSHTVSNRDKTITSSDLHCIHISQDYIIQVNNKP